MSTMRPIGNGDGYGYGNGYSYGYGYGNGHYDYVPVVGNRFISIKFHAITGVDTFPRYPYHTITLNLEIKRSVGVLS